MLMILEISECLQITKNKNQDFQRRAVALEHLYEHKYKQLHMK